jgi:DNA-3-methyladenine glycosylase II
MSTKKCEAALAHFKSCDAVMFALLSQSLINTTPIKFAKPSKPEAYFEKIVDSIIGQQISTKAAAAVRGRVHTLLGIVTPERITDTPDADLRASGLSPQKLSYLKRNALVWSTIPYHDFPKLSDEAVIAELTKLYGVGRWTAEMFCIFTLARPDVFSYGDLGLMQSLYRYYKYKPHYTRKIKATVEGWSPYRSMAALALWQARDTGFEA